MAIHGTFFSCSWSLITEPPTKVVILLQVYNVVPSISAVTGISPGRYLWRVVIAFHIGPRMLIAAVYYNFLMSFVPFLVGPEAPNKAEWLTKLLKCCYYLQVSEVVGLCVISFVHNREHYRKYKLTYRTHARNRSWIVTAPPKKHAKFSFFKAFLS